MSDGLCLKSFLRLSVPCWMPARAEDTFRSTCARGQCWPSTRSTLYFLREFMETFQELKTGLQNMAKLWLGWCLASKGWFIYEIYIYICFFTACFKYIYICFLLHVLNIYIYISWDFMQKEMIYLFLWKICEPFKAFIIFAIKRINFSDMKTTPRLFKP